MYISCAINMWSCPYAVLLAVLCVLCIVYCVLCTVCCVLCTVYCVLCIVYCVLCTVYCVLCTVYCVLCTVYCVLCSLVIMPTTLCLLGVCTQGVRYLSIATGLTVFLACSVSPTSTPYHTSSTSIEGKVGTLPYFRFCIAHWVDIWCTYESTVANLIALQIPQRIEPHIMLFIEKWVSVFFVFVRTRVQVLVTRPPLLTGGLTGKGKCKVLPRTGHEGPEGE
jgi:hypothetical protein